LYEPDFIIIRCVEEPVRAVGGIHYHQANATSIDFAKKIVNCRDVYTHYETGTNLCFDLPYDKLAVAVGTKSNTFGLLESREEEGDSPTGTSRPNVFFLKQLQHARAIRNRIIECFERASSPFITEEERKRLLTFVVVGGGPTSIEFTSELSDFVREDVIKYYRDLRGDYQIVVVEAAKHLLGSFDATLSSYVEKQMLKRKVTLLNNESVKEVKDVSVVLSSGKEIPFGVCVWSTGNTALDFVRRLNVPLTKDNRICVEDNLQVVGLQDVFAIGDAAANQTVPLPMLAQVANQQGHHLAVCMNNATPEQPFKYKFMGMMAQLGLFQAVADVHGTKLTGATAFLAWRSAYWTLTVSITNKILIPMYWFKSYWFGRDISKF
jgi:NADH dehydrogenase FAD-containing subunit